MRETRSIREVMAAEPVAPPTQRDDQPSGAAAGGGPRATSQVTDAAPDERGQAATRGPLTTREAPASAPRNGSDAQLVGVSIAQDLRTRWEAVQTGFVDEPRQAVQQADELLAEAMKQVAATFAHERASLERQWAHGGDVSTEELRIALQRYRAFFERLLAL